MNKGRQHIHNPLLTDDEFRYANFMFCFGWNLPDYVEPHILRIPIPYMKKDHGIFFLAKNIFWPFARKHYRKTRLIVF